MKNSYENVDVAESDFPTRFLYPSDPMTITKGRNKKKETGS